MKKNIIKNIAIIIVLVLIITCVTIGISFYSKKNSSIVKSKINFRLNMNDWNYDEEHNIYYKMGIEYCENSKKEENEAFEIYVPGEYFNGEKNEDGTYRCSINNEGTKSVYISKNAPTIISIESKEDKEQKPHEKYDIEYILKYINEGYIYIWPGYRGLEETQEAGSDEEYKNAIIEGITDLKAIVKYLRYNWDILPGHKDKIMVLGKNNGGTKSAILGTSGNSELYSQYLTSIGALTRDNNDEKISDAVNAVMTCSPLINIETLKESYSWLIEQYIEKNSDIINQYNGEYSDYVNSLKLKSEEGTYLYIIDGSDKKMFIDGTYYNYILSELEKYINFFLQNISFPYTSNKTGITYKTAKEYIENLNSKQKWITYVEETNTIKINSIKEFACYYKDKDEKIEKSVDENLYNVYYYLSGKYRGRGTSTVARYWNIYSILDDKCSSFLTEENMKLLLQKNEETRKVAYNYMWARDYTDEEKEKIIFDNFKSWVKICY